MHKWLLFTASSKSMLLSDGCSTLLRHPLYNLPVSPLLPGCTHNYRLLFRCKKLPLCCWRNTEPIARRKPNCFPINNSLPFPSKDCINFLILFMCMDKRYARLAVECVEGELFHFHENPSKLCPVGKNIHAILDTRLEEIQKAMEQEMASVTIQDIMEDTKKLIMAEPNTPPQINGGTL